MLTPNLGIGSVCGGTGSMSLLLQELFSAKVEASGSRIHADERVSDRRLDAENQRPMPGD